MKTTNAMLRHTGEMAGRSLVVHGFSWLLMLALVCVAIATRFDGV